MLAIVIKIGHTMNMKIHGDYHTHTCFSDGKTTIIEMVRTAKERDLREIAITDHSLNKIFKGFRKRNFERYCNECESAKSEMPVLIGLETNVVSVDGHIDIDDEMSEKLDIVLFGVHVAIFYSFRGFFTFFLPNVFFNMIHYVPQWLVRRNTKIVKKAIEKNIIDIWTHPNRYFKIDVVEVARTCAERETLIELNSKRISFRPVDFERMVGLGAKFIINSDAHTPKRIGETSRVEEFLKNCDYNPADIINLTQTYTEYRNKGKNDDIIGTDQERNTQEQEPPKKRRGFTRWF